MPIKTKKTFGFRNSSEVLALVTSFENCRLPLEEWTRENFLTLVFWYLFMNSPAQARYLIRSGVRRYQFEHNLAPHRTDHGTTFDISISELRDYLKLYRNSEPFADQVNRMQRHFAGHEQEHTKTIPVQKSDRHKIFADLKGRNATVRKRIDDIRHAP